MTTHKTHVLEWQEHKNGITIDCSLDIVITPARSSTVLLIIPGVDGSVDGYENKYKRIAESVNDIYEVAVVRTSNPFISSFHWESNVRRIMDFIENNPLDIAGTEEVEVRIMAHSAGASIVAHIAHEYPRIARLLLINPAAKLGSDQFTEGLLRFKGSFNVLMGSQDPNLSDLKHIKVDIVKGADHNFSGEAFETFLNAPHKYLFDQI